MKKKNIYSSAIIAFCSFLLLLSACSTKKNTAYYRGWHNMNARYNGYFYSNENFKESVKKVEKANKDDFNKLIPLFIYPDNQNAKSYYSDFDKTIKKSSTVIQRHAIVNKNKEEIANACKWIDENYMLIGKAHLYKRDFFSALEEFEYVSKKYPNPEAKYAGMLWMLRTNNEIGSFSKSEPIIDDLRTAKDFPKDKNFQQELAIVCADFYIKRNDYAGGITQLTKAISLTKNKIKRGRYTYVLAQLYQKQGDNKRASMYFQMVPGLHPGYDMEFSAQIKRAMLFDTQSGDSKALKKQLMTMLKDAKNKEFHDQIYYALAEIANKENDTPGALAYLDKSIRESVANKTQKALSYLKRADIYFDKANYKSAKANYDSTMAILPKDFPDYSLIEDKKKSLTELVTNLNIITNEDSVQRMGKMTEAERNAAVESMIAKAEEEEKKKEEERLELLKNPPPSVTNQTTPTTGLPASSSAWYFYNPGTVSFGAGEFTKKWGSRKLEDNWRRSDKEIQIAAATDEESLHVDSTEIKGVASAKDGTKNKKDKSYYLKNIPVNSDAVAKSNIKIVEAFYNVGSIYKERLLNNAKSVEAFEELLKRYPDNKYKLECYYQLYRTYMAMNNNTKSDYYKNILLNDFPDTEYAKIIKNPSYAKDVMASKNQVEKFYAATYQLYSEGNYSACLSNCLLADTSYSKSNLMPQFDFVKALCIGRTQDINSFAAALTQVVIKYPKAAVREKAQEMLDLIKKQKYPEKTIASVSKDSLQPKPKFIFKEDGEYYWLVTVANGKGDINKFKAKLSDADEESFGTDELTISSVFLDAAHQLISVKTFDGKGKAMDYYNFFKDNKYMFSDLEPGSYQSFIISSENYTTFYKDKNIEEYKQFFTQNFK